MPNFKFFSVAFLSSFILLSCAASKSSVGLFLNPTIYYKPTIHKYKAKCSSNSLRDLISPDGRTLVALCESDYRECLLQGSCFVDDGEQVTSYNYHSTRDGVPRFVVVDLTICPYGYGVRESCLDPYFSAAADLEFYHPGDVIFVPRLIGAVMPDGEVHDGFIVIRDSGGRIVGANRFDFFTGLYSHRQRQNVFARLGFSDPKNRFEFRMATKDEAVATRVRRNYPGLRKNLIIKANQH